MVKNNNDNVDILDIIIILLTIVITYVIFIKPRVHQKENLQNTDSTNKDANQTNTNGDKSKTLVRQIDILEDGSFSDVVLYKSEHIIGQSTGLDKCLEKCNGTCVEFGYSGDTMCFPQYTK